MTKKFTSLLVLAAIALAIPIHAQTDASKKATAERFPIHKSLTLKTSKSMQAVESKAAAANNVGIAFRQVNAESKDVKSIIRNVQEDKASFEKLMTSNFFAIKLGEGSVSSRNLSMTPMASSVKKNSRRAEAVDAHGIITSPAEGVRKMYTRAGKAYYWDNNKNKRVSANQEGMAEIVEASDGTIYIKDLLSTVNVNTWVKGTKVGNTITIPAGQMIYYWENDDYGLYLAKAEWGDTFTKVDGDITLTVNGDVISLNDTDMENPIGAFYSNNNTFSDFGDYSTVLTYDPTFVIPDLVALPEGATVETWYNNGKRFDGTVTERYEQTTAKVAFVGNDVYLSGIFENFPNSWIKGTLNGTTVTFAGGQFVGTYSSYNIYAFGCDGFTTTSSLQDFQMTYDATAKTLEAVNPLLGNTSDEEIYFLEAYQDLLISKNEPTIEEPVATTGANVEAPYSNALNTAGLFGEFGVIDSNEDGKTWSFDANAKSAKYAYSLIAANDWLVSPAVKLEAGKTYRFAIDAFVASSNWAERVEVKIGKEPKASAMTQEVLEATVLNNENAQTLENAVRVTETGYYHFGIHAISDANMFNLYVNNFLVEAGVSLSAPAPVTDLTVVAGDNKLEATISFKAPTKTAGESTLSSLTKIEILRDGEVVKTLTEGLTPGGEYSYVDKDPALVAGTHIYQVIPYNESGMGIKSDAISVFLSAVLQIPVFVDFSHEGSYDQFQSIDANNDGKTWAWDIEKGAYNTYSVTNAADDYLVSLPIHLETGMNYNLIVTATAADSKYPEKFEVKLGKVATAEGLNITIMDEKVVESAEETDYENIFTVEETGDYYLAVHAISEADMYQLIINRIIVDRGPSPTAPAPITDFTVTPGAKGALEVNIAFTTPSTYINGAPAEGTMDVDIYRDMVIVKTLKDLPYGTAQTWKDTDVEEGKKYTYLLMPSNATGMGERSDHLDAFVGHDIPAALTGLTATDNATSITFGWQKVGEEGANGGYVDPTQVDYQVWNLKVQETSFGDYLVPDEKITSVKDASSYELEFNTEEGNQEFKYWGVVPANELGEGDGMAVSKIVGAAYTLPFIENFENGTLHYLWYGSENSGLYSSEDSSDGDDSAMKLVVFDEPGVASINSGKLNLNNATNPTLFFDVRSETLTKLNVLGSTNGAKFITVQADVPVTAEYTTVKVPLNSLKNGRYAQIAISADFAVATVTDWGDALLIDNIRIVDLYANDLSVKVEAPATVEAGLNVTIKAIVKNEGENAATGYTIKVKAEDKELLNQTVSEVLEPNQAKEFTAELETNVVDDAVGVTITAEVVYADDQFVDNNTAETLISIEESSLPAPVNVTATDKGADGVELAWSAPGSEARAAEEATTETFENGMGDFTLIDADGDGKNWKHHINTGINNHKVHSGVGSVYSQSYADKALNPDNWLVTPLATLGGTFSFWACGQDANYAEEHFAVFVSTTTADDPAAFTQVSEEFVATSDMTQYTVDLSAYAGQTGYIAIRHFNVSDLFELVVDDVTFARAIPALVGYNVYYEREKIAAVEGDKTTYTVAADKVTDGEHTFGISAVYENGRESKIVTALVTIGTDIRQISADGKPVDVYSLDGKLVRSQVKSLAGLKGVYVINGKTVMVK